MNTKIVMAASAAAMGVAGIAGSFLPQELLAALHVPGGAVPTLMVQLHGAVLLAFAMVNWMGKDSLIGGIYNRPVAVGNLMHFAVGAITLAKFAIGGHTAPGALAVTAVYVLFAAAFAVIVFGRAPVVSPGAA